MKKLPLAFLLMLALGLTSFALYKCYGDAPAQSARARFEAAPAPVRDSLHARYLSLYPKAALPLLLRQDLLFDKQWRQPVFGSEMAPFVFGLEVAEYSRSWSREYRPVAHLATAADFDVLLYAFGYTYTLDGQKFMLQTLSRQTGKVINEVEVSYVDEGFHIQAEVQASGRDVRVFDAVSGKDVRLLHIDEAGKIRILAQS